jgi:hypothetical protein
MKRSDFLKILCVAGIMFLFSFKNASGGNLHEQLAYLYFFSAITLLLFYRAKTS